MSTYWYAYAYVVQDVQPAFDATAALCGTTVLGSPVAYTAWIATAIVRQPVHVVDVAAARFSLPTVGPPTELTWRPDRATDEPSAVVSATTA